MLEPKFAVAMALLPSPSTLMALAGLAGVLATWTLLTVTVLTFLWNKLDKRFDDMEARQNRQFDDIKTVMREDRAEQSRRLEESQARQDKRFAELKTVMREDRAEQSRQLEESEARQDKRLAESEARQNRQFDEIKVEMRENKAAIKELGEALLTVKA